MSLAQGSNNVRNEETKKAKGSKEERKTEKNIWKEDWKKEREKKTLKARNEERRAEIRDPRQGRARAPFE